MLTIFKYKMTVIALALSVCSAQSFAYQLHCGGKNASQVCDVTFTTPLPTYTNMCTVSVPQTQIYTIRNNTPVPVRLNGIKILPNDSLGEDATRLGQAPANNCVSGSNLAAGATCNIALTLTPRIQGVYNRVLQVGIDTRQVELLAPAITSAVDCGPDLPPVPPGPPEPPPAPATPPVTLPLGINNCSILGAVGVTNTGGTSLTGVRGLPANLCITPNGASSITGFNPSGTYSGQQFVASDAPAVEGKAGSLALYNSLNGLSGACIPVPADVGGLTYSQPAGTTGVYCFASTAAITGTLTLDGPGNYVFLVSSSLTTAAGAPGAPASQIRLINNANARDIYWDIGTGGSGSATLGTYSIFQGRIIAQDSVSLKTQASLLGSATALTAAVTLDTNAVIQQAY